MEMQEVVRPIGSHAERVTNESPIHETTMETNERGGEILQDANSKPCPDKVRESLRGIQT